MLSIDQNSHSLWDALPKLEALARAGRSVSHYVEDVDVAFTALGADQDAHQPLRLERERYHHSGGADWGAAMFYTCFLGRQGVDLRDWEPYTGLKSAALARQLGTTLEALYDRYSPSDNWQLIGPSYAGAGLHRTIADLRLDQTLEFLHRLMDLAHADLLERLPEPPCQARVREWFEAERRRVAGLVGRCDPPTLARLYQLWLGEYLADRVPIGLSSDLLAPAVDGPAQRLLGLFLRDYDLLSGLYNESIQCVRIGLRPLHTDAGELPFFAALGHNGRCVRTSLFREDGGVRVGEQIIPITSDHQLDVDALRGAGVTSLAGKAVMLVIQLRLGPAGQSLALPYHGSIYMCAAYELTRQLRRHNLLSEPLQPVVRVRLGLLDHLRELDTVIRLPPYLAREMGRDEVPARVLGESAAEIQAQAQRRLESFTSPQGRHAWQQQAHAPLTHRLAELDARRRELAAADPKDPQLHRIGPEMKAIQTQLLQALVEQIDRDWQLARLDYYDSRGAILPWCVGLGGRGFYDRLIASARIYDETE